MHIKDKNVDTGSIPVSFCLSKDVLDWYTERAGLVRYPKMGEDEPRVLLVVAPHGPAYHQRHERRYIVFLKDILAYIQFRNPGETNIFAALLRPNRDLSYEGHETRLLARSGGEYQTWVLNKDGTDFYRAFLASDAECEKLLFGYHGNPMNELEPELADKIRAFSTTVTRVHVPETCFANRPPEWLRTWVNLWETDREIDECDFRKRMIFALTLQPILFMIVMFYRLVIALFCFGLLKRGARARALYQPLTYEASDIYRDTGESILVQSWNNAFRNLPLVLTPLSLALCAGGAWILSEMYHENLLSYFVITMGGIVLVMSFFAFMIEVNLWNNFRLEMSTLKEKPASVRSTTHPWYLEEAELALITCQSGRPILRFDDLPKRRRTIYLRIQTLKAQVCRPFSS